MNELAGKPSETPSHVVGIGASAGGLNALETFFDRLPADTNMAFVVIQHLSPHFKSLMDDLLARHTSMPIYVASHGLHVEANTVYLIPPNTQMAIEDNRLLLSQRKPSNVVDLPIDVFLNSLAHSAKSSAVAIILSGTGTDGSRGIKAVRQEGGMVMVQSPETAQFDGMPHAALATGVCDRVSSPGELAELLGEYSRDPALFRNGVLKQNKGDLSPAEFGDIFEQLQHAFQIDFSRYKMPTVARRIVRRMDFMQVKTIPEYASFLALNPAELQSLYHDLLIGVTEFFREPEFFEYLAREVFPALIREIRPGEDLRIWSAGCATGEETYSLAIIAMEAAEAVDFKGRISVFGTDVHRESLEIASAGSYESQRLANVTPDRLTRFFRKDGDDRYRVTSDLRKIVIFAAHNLAKDAPFTKLDLVCCRNLLIYFQTDLQDRVISLFHFALRQHGILFLGTSETPGAHACAFDAFDSSRKIYRKSCEKLVPISLPAAPISRMPQPIIPSPQSSSRVQNIDRQLLHDYDSILARQAPGVIVNENRQVLHYCGDISRFMAAPRGRPTRDLFDLAEGELQIAIYTALPRAEKSGEAVSIRNVRLQVEDGEIFATIAVEPIWDSRTRTTHYHIYFTDIRPTIPLPVVDEATAENENKFDYPQLISDLRNELHSTKENLQTAVEELQASNEELQATNEELLAANEELQSTNEELHSVNEELYTVNTEFERKNAELAEINLDHEHLLGSIEVGIIFLDKNLRIRKFNEFVISSFKLLPQDLGRPIDHIAYHLEDGRKVLDDIQEVLRTGKLLENEVLTPEGAVLLKRILPYLNEQGQVDGAVLTFTDVSHLKEAERKVSRMNADLERLVDDRTRELRLQIAAREQTEAALKESLEKYKVLFTTLQPLAFMLTDEKGRIREVNPYATQLFNASEDQLLQRTVDSGEWRMVTPEDTTLPQAEYTAVKAFRSGEAVIGQEVAVRRPDGSLRWLSMSAAPVPLNNYGVAVTALDISGRKSALNALMASERRFRTLFEAMQEGFALFELLRDEEGRACDYRFLEVNTAFSAFADKPVDEIVGKTMRDLFPGEPPLWLDRVSQVVESGVACEFEEYVESLNRYVEVNVFSPARDQFATLIQDITSRRRFQEEQLRRQKLESLGILAGGIAHDFNNLFTGVMANLSLLVDRDGLTPDTRQTLSETLEGCSRASALSRQLLTFAKGGDPIKKILSPKKILEESASMIACGRDTTWEWTVAGDVSPIEADPGQLMQVFNNILINAVQAMPSGGTVRIGIENENLQPGNEMALPPGPYVKIRLADNGCGVSPALLDKIFDPFFTTKDTGAGLGLASVHSIVKRHGGHVAVASKVGRGTAFTLHFPATVKSMPEPAAEMLPSPTNAVKGARVLVMEDDPLIRRVLCQIIGSLEHSVEAVITGAEAVEEYRKALAQNARFDAVILDLTVPGGMGGAAVAQEILRLDPAARLIVSSGYSNHPVMSRFREHGFCAAMTKPYLAQDLMRVLSEVLSGGKSVAAAV